MSRTAAATETLPAPAGAALRKLGADLGTSRKRRGQSLREWAARMQISVPTLMRLEKGDPTVSMGVYVTALWLITRHEALRALADPSEDLAALEADIRKAQQRHRPRGKRGE